MMTSSNGNIFRVIGHYRGEFTGHRWIPRTKASDAEIWCFLCVWINGWVNNREAGDLRRYRAHYEVTVMWSKYWLPTQYHIRVYSCHCCRAAETLTKCGRDLKDLNYVVAKSKSLITQNWTNSPRMRISCFLKILWIGFAKYPRPMSTTNRLPRFNNNCGEKCKPLACGYA